MIELQDELTEYKGYKIRWFYDEDPMNPRDNDNIAPMICWHSRYSLGDHHAYNTPRDFLADLVDKLCTEDEVIEFVLSGKGDCKGIYHNYTQEEKERIEKEDNLIVETSGYLELIDGAHDDVDFVDCSSAKECLRDYYGVSYVLDCFLSNDDLETLIERHAVLYTLSLYDHSGISISLGAPTDMWDSGYVGYVYATKRVVLSECNANEENWREIATKCIYDEVQEYDYYIQGEVFGYQILDPDGDEIDGCWGFFGYESISSTTEECKKYIDELVDEK